MASIIVKCNICNQTLLEASGPKLDANEVALYSKSCSCNLDGPFQSYDEDGNPLPMDYSNIIATLSE